MKRASVFGVLSAPSMMPIVQWEEEVEVFGWVRTIRGSKNVSFIVLHDGSTFESLQVVVDSELGIDLSKISSGTAIRVIGAPVESKGSGQEVDLDTTHVEVIGECGEDYPMQPKKHSMEFFREHPHLRMRTKLFQAIFRIRHRTKMAVNEFFDMGAFIQVDTPILTGSDCEGAGEMFSVTTSPLGQLYTPADDFFGTEVGLTVSGQLEAETAAMGLGRVYTFGPTFRAENSHTSRHLSEFWMIEPEMAFADLQYNMDISEGFLKYVILEVMKKCKKEIEYLDEYTQQEEKNFKKEDRSEPLMDKLIATSSCDFERITYTEAFDILRNSKPNKKGRFEFPVEKWGMDFQAEHERYLVEKHFKKPVIVRDYPKEIKSFYMRDNDDGKTVAAMDILFPGIGEIVGGSQREERLDVLKEKMTTFDISHDDMKWYLDTRRFGTCPHSGFGVGFERLVQFITGMKNIRDVVLYPRTPGKL